MDQLYFESGYLEAGYFQIIKQTEAVLTTTVSFTATVDIANTANYFIPDYIEEGYFQPPIKEGSAALTVNTTHSTEIQRNRFAEVSITDAFNATFTVSISKNLFSTLASQFDLSITASKIASNQSTLDNIVTLSLQANRSRDLASTTLSSSFTLTTQIERIQTAQSTQNTAFTLTTNTTKILNAQSDQSSAVTVTAQIDKILNAQSAVTVTSTITTTVEKISNGASTQNLNSTLTVTVSKIISGNVNLTDAFTSTFTVVVTKNHTADLNSAFSISVQAIKTISNIISLNSEFNTTTTADRTRSTTVTITAEISHSIQSDRIRLFAVTVSSDVNVAVAIGKIVQASVTINSAFEPTLTVTVFRNHTAALMAEFAIQITAQKFGNNIIDLTSAFGITAGVDRIRLFTIAIELNHSLNGVISRIRQGNFEQSATFTIQASTGTIKQSQIALSDVFNAQLAVIVFRNHTATLASVIEISAVGTVTRSAVISVASTVSTSVTVSITRGFEMQSTAETTQSTQITITRNFVVSVNVLTQISTVITRIQSAQINIQDAFVTQLTVNISRDNTITATVTVTQSTTVNKIVGVISTISTAVTFNATGARIRFVQNNSTAVSRLGRTGAARTAKTITTVGDAKISTADYAIGSASLVFDGSGDKLTVPASTDFALGTGDFCIEFFAKSGATFGEFNSTRNILDFRASNTNTVAPEIYLGSGNTIHYRVNGVNRISVTATTGALPYVLSVSSFNHVAVSRVSGSTRMYVDGVAAATVYTDSNDYVQGGLTIGGVVGESGNFAGYLDEIRIIKGTSPYSGNSITVPYSGLTNTAETVLLIHAEGANNSTNITDDVQGFVENAEVNRTASAQANIQDAFVSTMTVNTVLGITVNLTSTTEFTVLGTRVRLLNQGIGAESTLVSQVDRIISVTADLQSTVTTTGTVDRIRSVTAQFTDVFTAQMSITVSVNLVATLNTAFAFTVIPNRLLNSNAAIQGAFSISTAINGSFAITATVTAQSTVAATVGLRKTAQCNIQARFSRVLNQGVTRSVTIIDTETPNEEYGAVGSALARFDGNSYLDLSNMPIIGTGDYTIEMLAHRSAEMGDGSTFIEQDLFNADRVFRGYGVSQLGPHIYIGNDDEIKAGNTYIFQGDQITTGAFKFQTDANLHIALVRHNAQTRLYVNGVQRGDTIADTVSWTSTDWLVGDVFLGYVDEFRVSNTARYTANFTNPYADLTQDTPFVPDANTIIYLSFDTVIDEPICSVSVRKTTSANLQSQMSRIVTEGGVTVSAVNKFGGNSVQFDGVNDRITILNQPALSTGDFTVEMFFRRSLEQNDSTLMTLMQMYDDADSTISDELSININTNEQVQYLVRGDVKLLSNRIFDITDWHRVTVVRRNNVTKMWLDNQFTGDSFFDNNPINSNQVYVGNNQDLTAPYRGYVDDLQINRYSRYTTQHSTNSALPDQPYQFVGDGSSVMLHFNNAQIDLPLVEVSTVIRPTTVSISGVFTPNITINTEINVAITLSSATTFTCAVSVIKPGTAAHTAQSQLVVVFTKIRNIQFVGAVQSSITATGDLVKLFVGTAQSISSVNVIAVSTKNIQSNINTATTLNTTVNQTAGAVINIAVTVSTQATVTRIQTVISNITVNGAVNVTITRIHPGVAAITVNHTVSAQAQKTVNSVAAITTIATQTVLVGEIVQFSCAIQTEAATLTVAVRTGDFFVNMDSAFGLIANVSRTRSSSAQFNSAIEFAVTDFRFKQFEAELSTISTQSTIVSRTRPATVNVQTETNISITILRIKSSSTAIAVSTTHTVTAHKTGSGAAILVGTFTITAQPQPLNQILTVVRATMVGTLTATVRKVFLEEYEYRIREEVRTLNIVEEQRNYLIVEEQRTLTIQGAE